VPGWIRKTQRIVSDISVSIKRLWICQGSEQCVRAGEATLRAGKVSGLREIQSGFRVPFVAREFLAIVVTAATETYGRGFSWPLSELQFLSPLVLYQWRSPVPFAAWSDQYFQ